MKEWGLKSKENSAAMNLNIHAAVLKQSPSMHFDCCMTGGQTVSKYFQDLQNLLQVLRIYTKDTALQKEKRS